MAPGFTKETLKGLRKILRLYGFTIASGTGKGLSEAGGRVLIKRGPIEYFHTGCSIGVFTSLTLERGLCDPTWQREYDLAAESGKGDGWNYFMNWPGKRSGEVTIFCKPPVLTDEEKKKVKHLLKMNLLG